MKKNKPIRLDQIKNGHYFDYHIFKQGSIKKIKYEYNSCLIQYPDGNTYREKANMLVVSIPKWKVWLPKVFGDHQ